MKTKIVNTREYVSALRELVGNGEEVCLPVAGWSMSPFLAHERDVICFSKPAEDLKKGDMVFYQRGSGQYVMHRICKVKKEGYYLVGDAQQEIEGPIERERIFAVVIRVRRKGEWIGPENFWWKFFAVAWIRVIPLRRFIMRIYSRSRSRA